MLKAFNEALLSWWGLEYADSIPCNPSPLKKRSVLAMALNSIWLWGSSSEDLGSVEYLFIAITLRSTLTQSVRIPSMGQIDLFKNHLYLIGPYAKKS